MKYPEYHAHCVIIIRQEVSQSSLRLQRQMFGEIQYI
jgi:hypothetical protein